MLTPAAKRRRRAEAATATLSRPFRSPAVRRGGGVRVNSPREAPKTQDTETRKAAARPASVSATSAKDEPPALAASPERIHKRRGLPDQLKEATRPVKEDRALSLGSLVDQFCLDLDAGDKILEDTRISANEGLWQQQETVAKTKESQNSEDDDSNKELRALIVRWKEAGRLAAEDMFSIVSERVARAGGIKAWRTMAFQQPEEDNERDRRNTRRRRNDRHEDDNGNEGVQDGDESSYEDEDEESENNKDEAEESQDFTMATMLASMGVDLELLGYDEIEERWKD